MDYVKFHVDSKNKSNFLGLSKILKKYDKIFKKNFLGSTVSLRFTSSREVGKSFQTINVYYCIFWNFFEK